MNTTAWSWSTILFRVHTYRILFVLVRTLYSIPLRNSLTVMLMLSAESSSPKIPRYTRNCARLPGSTRGLLTAQEDGQAYDDKLNGTITEDFWQRKMEEWRAEEQQILIALDGFQACRNSDRLLNAKRILELANKASFLYLSYNSAQRARFLKLILLNCSIDELSVYPTYRYPFDRVFERVKTKEWSGREDLNLRPPGPEPDSTSY